MRLTEQQDLLLRKYLRHILRYRETYEEVYDHIISALEFNSYQGTLEEAINKILQDDFGGYDELRDMEDKAERIALTDGTAKFFKYFASYFKWPLVPFTLALMLLVFYTIARINISAIAFEAIFTTIILTPSLLSLRRYYIIGYLFKNTNKSLRDEVFGNLASTPIRLFVFCTFALTILKHIWQNANPWLLTTLYTLAIIYLLALYKLYCDEFKMNLTENR